MKKTKIFPSMFLLLMLSFQVIKAQTNVSGGLYSNTTWTAANSPYIITDTIVVFPGITLTIQPGVVVKFNDGGRIEIRQGKIIAQGSISDSIVFSSNSLNPTQGIWDQIYLNACSDTSRFNYCNFLYAGTCISSYGGSTLNLVIKNSNFINNNTVFDIENSIVDSCNFKNNMYCIVWMLGSLNHSEFRNNNIGLSGGIQNLQIKNCKFISNQTGFSFAGENILIENCIIDSNSVAGIVYSGSTIGDTLINCTIRNNNIGIQIENYSGTSLITRCIIEDNIIGIKANCNAMIYCNRFCNNISYDFYNNSTSSLNITNNYWCTSDSSSISLRIYDGYDNASFGLVDFIPIDSNQCYLNGCSLTVFADVLNATCDTCHDGSATAQVNNGTFPFNYTWYTAPLQNAQTVTNLSAGTYTLCVTDANGCSACNNTIIVNSSNCNNFSITAHSSDVTCSNCNDGSAWALVNGGSEPYYYTWYTNPMQTSDSITSLSQGNYVVCVADNNGCYSCDTVLVSIGNCSAHFNLYPDTILHQYIAVNMASGIPPLTYVWNWGDGNTSAIPYPSHIYSSAGFYTICLTITDSVGCISNYCNSFYLQKNPNAMVQVTVIPQNTTDIQSNYFFENINIFPVPALDYLTVTLPKNLIESDIKIYNLIGQLELESKIKNEFNNLNISCLKKGIYVIELTNEDAIFRKKFIKQ